MKMIPKFIVITALSLLVTGANAQSVGQLQPGQAWGNGTGTQAPAGGYTIQQLLAQAPLTSLPLFNATSGSITLQPPTGALGSVTLTLPDVTDTLTALAATQTLTNKTLTSSTDVLGGVTMTLGSDATGDLYYRSSGVLTRLPIGSTGNVLEVSGGLPAWVAAPGGGNVTGPGSSTATGIARYSGTGGTTLLNSSVTIDGSNNVAAPGTITSSAGVLINGSGSSMLSFQNGSGTTIGTLSQNGGTGLLTFATAAGGIGTALTVNYMTGNAAFTGSGSFANIATGVAAHTIPINAGASVQANTGTGSIGQALISGGASADPSFKSGTWVLLNTLTASSSTTLSDTSSLTSNYNDYKLVFENILPASNATSCEIQVHSGGAFPATSYSSNSVFGNGTSAAAQTATTYIPCSVASTVSNSGPGIGGETVIFNAAGTSTPKNWVGTFITGASSANISVGYWNGGNGAIDGFQVLFSSGNIASGIIKVYGRL